MTAPVPVTLEDLLHAVVEACVAELVAARREVTMVRLATTTERQELEALLAEREAELANARNQVAALERAVDRLAREAPTAERSADAHAVMAPSGVPDHPSAQPTAVGALHRGRPSVDLTGVRVGTFVGIEKTRGRIAGAVVWLFRCELCGAERGWTNSHVQATKRARIPGRCSCQGGPKPVKAPILRAAPAYKPQTDGTKADEELEDLSQLDDLDADGLLSRAMAEAEGDGFIRRTAAAAAPRKRDRDREDDEDGGEGAELDPETGADEDDDATEELDFE